MGTIEIGDLRQGALVLLDASPIIYFAEDHPALAPRFEPLFVAHAAERLRIAVSTITIAEVLVGPLRAGDEALERRYRAILERWQPIPLSVEIADAAARLRASLGLKLPDAIQAASALAINADALVTHDRDFSRLKALRVIS
jgi:predicted nucleic acid-binding protein